MQNFQVIENPASKPRRANLGDLDLLFIIRVVIIVIGIICAHEIGDFFVIGIF
jgi:hypothetical protein